MLQLPHSFILSRARGTLFIPLLLYRCVRPFYLRSQFMPHWSTPYASIALGHSPVRVSIKAQTRGSIRQSVCARSNDHSLIDASLVCKDRASRAASGLYSTVARAPQFHPSELNRYIAPSFNSIEHRENSLRIESHV